MAAGVEELLSQLYEMIQDAWGVPLSSEKCVILRDKALDILDDINAQLPSDLKQAKNIVENRGEVLDSAKKEAEAIIQQAEAQARQMISEREILKEARKRANEMLLAADTKSRELRKATNEYVDDALRRTEEAVTEALTEIRQSRSRFRSASQSVQQKPQQ